MSLNIFNYNCYQNTKKKQACSYKNRFFLLMVMIFSIIMSSLVTWKIDRDINMKVLNTYAINFYVETLKILNLMNEPQYNTFSHLTQINNATEVFKRYLNKFNHRKTMAKETIHNCLVFRKLIETQIILKL